MANAVASIKRAKIVIEKTPHYVLHSDRIRTAFPDSHFMLLWCAPERHMVVLKSQKDLQYHPIAASLIWKKYNTVICKQMESTPDRTHLIRCEHLENKAKDELSSATQFLKLGFFDWMADFPPFDYGIRKDCFAQLTSSDIYWCRKINRSYCTAESFPDFYCAGTMLSLLKLPMFMLRNIKESLSDVEGSLFDYYMKWLNSKMK